MEESSNAHIFLLQLDDHYLSLLDEEDPFPVSDEKYATELQLQEVIMSSLLSSLPHELQPCQVSEMVALKSETNPTPLKSVVTATGESSTIFCGICMDGKSVEEMFRSKNCFHMFCSECVGRHIAAKIQDNVVMVGCPDPECKGSLEPEFCQPMIPAEVFERWSNALCELEIIGSERFYCPYKDCSMLMADDGEEHVRESECPNCHRLFCAQCKVPWHSGIECDEYQKLNKDDSGRNDLQVMELANTKGWKRCPRCRFFVEKTEGCLHVTCRCGIEFCYRCASTWSDSHASCSSA